MKTAFIKFSSLVAVVACTLSACQDYDPFDYETVQKATVAREFAQNFEARYGKIDPNHDWGFYAIPSMPSFSSPQTRADNSDNVHVNRNQWPTDHDECLSQYMDIPGWPNVDGYYYNAPQNDVTIHDNNSEITHPAGDVTEYEIQVVSKWFRTTKITNPENYRANLHISDFFIQDVSSDIDRNTNGTPKYPTQNYDFAMDQLRFGSINSSNDPSDNTWTHINNFNRGSQNFEPHLHKSNTKRTIMYVESSGTEDFAYHSSDNDASTFYHNWVLVHLSWDEVMQDGQTHRRDGYYLAFDYESHKTNGDNIPTDNYYSNWIVKITPANYITQDESWPRRIMCEDLGNTFDYDFNDVVFDVFFQKKDETSSEAVITIQAAGGTMPIYVGVDPTADNASAYEVHKLLGYDGTSNFPPINAGPSTKSHAVAIYRLSQYVGTDGNLHNYSANENNPDLIKIYVVNTDKKTATDVVNEIRQVSATERGINNAPQKFACPNSVLWLKELDFIEYGYPHFKDWVSEKNGNYGESGSTPWYSTGINGSFLCGKAGESTGSSSSAIGGSFYISETYVPEENLKDEPDPANVIDPEPTIDPAAWLVRAVNESGYTTNCSAELNFSAISTWLEEGYQNVLVEIEAKSESGEAVDVELKQVQVDGHKTVWSGSTTVSGHGILTISLSDIAAQTPSNSLTFWWTGFSGTLTIKSISVTK